jgi:transporter family-2 protein
VVSAGRTATLLGVVAGGALIALQGRVNGALGTSLHSSLAAACVSFVVGNVVLAVVVVARARSRRGMRRLVETSTQWWWWLGGLAGAAVVTSSAAGVPEVGVALVSVCLVAGTSIGALLVDRAGLGPAGRHPVTPARLTSALLAVGAVVLGAVGERHATVRPMLFAFLVLAGAASAAQQAANGMVRVASRDTAVASLVSFTSGTTVLAVASLATGAFTGGRWPPNPGLYIGGLLGAAYIAVAATAVHRLGVLQLSLATVGGQLLGAVGLDLVAPAPGTRLRLVTIIGVLMTFAAIAVAGRSRRVAAPTPG